MVKKLWILCLLLPTLVFAKNDDVLNALKDYENSWNKGDMDAVVHYYKQSPSTTLIWSGIVKGYENIDTFLHKTYSENNMGRLTTSHIQIELLSNSHVLVTGEWVNDNNHQKMGGPFSMIYEKTSQGWKIVLDHGSANG